MADLPRKKILIYFPRFSLTHGGGEYLPLAFAAEFQKVGDVTLAVDTRTHLDSALAFYDMDIDAAELKTVNVFAEDYRPQNGVSPRMAFQRSRKLKKLAKNADVCISCANIMDFGRPAHHFLFTVDLGDPGFAEYVKTRRSPKRKGALSAVRDMAAGAVRRLLGMRTKRALIRDRSEHIYPNSDYVRSLLQGYYGSFNGTVFYPPSVFEIDGPPVPRDPLRIVCIGRVCPGKRIEEMIAIVERARELSGRELTFGIAGSAYSEEYRDKLDELTADRPWVEFPGQLSGREKAEFLCGGTYALHAMREEAFGISVTEYLKAGLIPIVPDEGGACEVVDAPELSFHTDDGAAALLVKLLNDAEFRERQLVHCAKRAEFFSRDAYFERQHKLLKEIVGS